MHTRFHTSRPFFALAAAVLALPALLSGSSAAAGGAKVEICHVPPGNPANFHTITVSENAMAAHLEHGDVAGACNALCAALCDDGNACTIDDAADCEENGCPSDRAPVDCNDGNECTADSCDPASGCANAPRTGEACDDGQACSGPDTCDANGACVGTPIDGCCLSDDQCSQNPCDGAFCDSTTNACEEEPVVCTPPDACSVSVCDAVTGDCANTPVVCGTGEMCNPTSGQCEQICPCADGFAEVSFDDPDVVRCTDDLPPLADGTGTELIGADGVTSLSSNRGGGGDLFCVAILPTGLSAAFVIPITDAEQVACADLIRERFNDVNCP